MYYLLENIIHCQPEDSSQGGEDSPPFPPTRKYPVNYFTIGYKILCFYITIMAIAFMVVVVQEFAKHLNLNQDTVQTAAKATAGTATATVSPSLQQQCPAAP